MNYIIMTILAVASYIAAYVGFCNTNIKITQWQFWAIVFGLIVGTSLFDLAGEMITEMLLMEE